MQTPRRRQEKGDLMQRFCSFNLKKAGKAAARFIRRAAMAVKKTIKTADFSFRKEFVRRVTALAIMVMVTIISVITVMAATGTTYVVYDGTATKVSIASGETDQLLEAAGITAGPNDIVEREEDSGGDITVTVSTAKSVSVTADGAVKTVTAHYGNTVADALSLAGVTLGANDQTSVPTDTAVSDGMNVDVTRYYNISIVADGSSAAAVVKEGTVAQAVQQAGIDLGGDDEISPPRDTPVTEGMQITIARISFQDITSTESVPFNTVTKKDSTMTAGTSKVESEGQDGLRTIVTRQTLSDGAVVSSEVISSAVTQQPVDKVVVVGTKYAGTAVRGVTGPGTFTDKNGNVVSYSKRLSGSCTSYTGGGTTSTGQKAAFGLVAVNPQVIPYGTKMYICSPDGKIVYGYATAADTGGALLSNRVLADLYYDANSPCQGIGRRTMEIYILN